MVRLLLVVAAAATFASPSLAQSSSLLSRLDTEKPAQSFALDPTLAEISGLATAGPTSVFAHNDEHAIIHELDVTNGTIIRSFALGRPTIAGDFEAIVARGEFIYLVTSDGLLHEAPIKKHRERARYVVYDTGLGDTCEIEGMALDGSGAFLFQCKNSTLDKENRRLTIYRWRLEDRFRETSPWLEVPLADIIPDKDKRQNFKASELQRAPRSGNLLVLDANAGAVIEITPQGAPVGYRLLARRTHPQAEGLALMPDGSLIVGDETRGVAGRLSIYRPR
jgi:uncharacterized protein YjiK